MGFRQNGTLMGLDVGRGSREYSVFCKEDNGE